MTRSAWHALLWFSVFAANVDAQPAPSPPPGIAVRELGHGVQFTDAKGYALYTYDVDLREPGKSACVADCAAMRPPAIAEMIPEKMPEGWAVVTRDDGAQQWAYNGRPLYRYVRDANAGATFGVDEGWNIAFTPIITPTGVSVGSTVRGHVLTTSAGKTLYTRTGDGKNNSPCDRACLQTWSPLKAPWAGFDFADFSVIKRSDGVFQWAFKGEPLFSFAGDAQPGDLNGDGYGGDWRPRILEPAPPAPNWVTVVKSDGGALYANKNGMTLYRLMLDKNWSDIALRSNGQCDKNCLAEYWTPVSAESQLPRLGHWSVVESEDHGLQWAYQGMPLYTLNLETQPGQLYYTTYRKFQWMKPIMYALPALPGVF